MEKKKLYNYPILESEMLKIIPLDEENLRLLIENRRTMGNNLGVKVTNIKPERTVIIAMKTFLQKIIEDKINYLWYTD